MTLLDQIIMDALSDLEDQVQMDFASHRTSADQIEHAVRESLIRHDDNFKAPSSSRAPADVYYEGESLYHINIKSMDVSKTFHMPNLISAYSLRKIFKKDQLFWIIRILHDSGRIISKEVWDIRNISWSNLQVSALGAGQIQIKNGLIPLTKHIGSHDEWLDEWYSIMSSYYNKEKIKIDRRARDWLNR